MCNDFTKHKVSVCKPRNGFSIHFITDGGTASGFHEFYRMTVDFHVLHTEKHNFDFWFDTLREKYFNILKAIKPLEIPISRLESE